MKPLLTGLLALTLAAGVWSQGAVAENSSSNANGSPKKSDTVRVTKGPVIEWVGSKDAVIAWSTNVRASTAMRYGTDKAALNETAKAPWGEATHRVHLRNLKPATEYFFIADSGQAQGTGSNASTGEGSFTTVPAGQKGKQYPKGRQ